YSNPELVTKQKSSHGHDNSVHNGVGRIGFQKGGVAARWVDESMGEVFKSEAERFIRQSAAGDKPFFLYYALHQPHVPRMPGDRFAGKSPLGLRGDVILEADWQVGELMRLLDELHLTENTLIIFSSDNGPVLNDGYYDQSIILNNKTGHKPSGNLRGGKYSNYCGGAQVPFIVYWKGVVTSGTSDALVCHVDFLASFAAALGVESEALAKLDSQNVFDALLGRSDSGRTELLVNGVTLRTPRWQFLPAPQWKKNVVPELYDLFSDPEETNNVWKGNPDVVKELQKKLDCILGSSK
ncbi:MAG: sulfatase-like hydrolase/transferase, partial [Thermoguttaceae bacterium]|nr:sulfatase-like hydrolase/transferase [Thermoguttaceae bacterium]